MLDAAVDDSNAAHATARGVQCRGSSAASRRRGCCLRPGCHVARVRPVRSLPCRARPVLGESTSFRPEDLGQLAATTPALML